MTTKPPAAPATAEEAEVSESRSVAIVPSSGDDGALSEAALVRAERQIAFLNRAKVIAIKSTNEDDWSMIQGVPYLERSGCLKVARVFGVSITDLTVTKDREQFADGPRITYNARANFHIGGATIPEEGVASSDDDFFAQRSEWVVEGGKKVKKKIDLPLHEIDLPSIHKKAVTNCFSRGIKAVLGLKFTPDDLRTAGLDIGKVKSLGFAQQDKTAGDSPEVASKRNQLGEWVMEMVGGDKTRYQKRLQELTAWKAQDGKEVKGKVSVKELSDKQVERHHEGRFPDTIGAAYREWRKSQPQEAPEPGENG